LRLIIWTRPFQVNARPVLRDLVGKTQSNISTPLFNAHKISVGVPTPIKYLGLFCGIISFRKSSTVNISFRLSPTAKPPMAYPSKLTSCKNFNDLIAANIQRSASVGRIPQKCFLGVAAKLLFLILSAQKQG
jgi:hypothetical protein